MAKAKIDDAWGIWTAARIETLRQLWAQGIACARIAEAVGGGFDAAGVAGKARRLGLGPHPSGLGRKKRPAADGPGEVHGSPDSTADNLTNPPSLKNSPIGDKVRQKPWEATGISRASWYRHGKPAVNPKLKRVTQSDIARLADVKPRTAQRFFRIMKHDYALWESVAAGGISAGAAERQIVADQAARRMAGV